MTQNVRDSSSRSIYSAPIQIPSNINEVKRPASAPPLLKVDGTVASSPTGDEGYDSAPSSPENGEDRKIFMPVALRKRSFESVGHKSDAVSKTDNAEHINTPTHSRTSSNVSRSRIDGEHLAGRRALDTNPKILRSFPALPESYKDRILSKMYDTKSNISSFFSRLKEEYPQLGAAQQRVSNFWSQNEIDSTVHTVSNNIQKSVLEARTKLVSMKSTLSLALKNKYEKIRESLKEKMQ